MPTVVIANHRYSATGAWGPRDYKLKAKYHKRDKFQFLDSAYVERTVGLEAEVYYECK